MLEGDKIKVAQGENPCYLLLNQANRHGLMAGASGTGKTVTMKVLAEGFAQAGVPVFMADVKGDVTGMAQPGDDTEKRARARGRPGRRQAGSLRGCDVRLWDMLDDARRSRAHHRFRHGAGAAGAAAGAHRRAAAACSTIAFRMADDNGMLLIDLKDLRAMLAYVSEHAKRGRDALTAACRRSRWAPSCARCSPLEDAGRRRLLRRTGAGYHWIGS